MFYDIIQNPILAIRHPRLAFEFYVKNVFKVGSLLVVKKNLWLEYAKKRHKVGRRVFINNEEYNRLLTQQIYDQKPFFSCRYGNSELVACYIAELVKKGINQSITDEQLHKLKHSSGVFTEEEDTYLSFAVKYCEALGQCNFNAYWGSVIMEEYMLEHFMSPCTKLMSMRALEPFQYERPWTMALEGKNVLVVSPFSDLFEKQYEKREKLFVNKNILPRFNLKTVKAIQSSGGNVPEEYLDWNEALEDLHKRCAMQEYDVALLSCGSYAVPLGAKLKADGKK